jgi:hypothetical protein
VGIDVALVEQIFDVPEQNGNLKCISAPSWTISGDLLN